MNERMKELCDQAMEVVFSSPSTGRETKQINLEKLTELIVVECLNVMSKTSKEAREKFTYMGDDVPTTTHQMEISKHFGIKNIGN